MYVMPTHHNSRINVFLPVLCHQDNVLVNDAGKPLLTDFGISRVVLESVTQTGTSTLKGNARWMAIELLQVGWEAGAHPFHTKESDVWAFGMTVSVYPCLCDIHCLLNPFIGSAHCTSALLRVET